MQNLKLTGDAALAAFSEEVQEVMVRKGVPFAEKIECFGAALMSIVIYVNKTRSNSADALAVDLALNKVLTLVAEYKNMRRGKAEDDFARPQQTDA